MIVNIVIIIMFYILCVYSFAYFDHVDFDLIQS